MLSNAESVSEIMSNYAAVALPYQFSAKMAKKGFNFPSNFHSIYSIRNSILLESITTIVYFL